MKGAVIGLVAAVLIAAAAPVAFAQEAGDTATTQVSQLLAGQRAAIELVVRTAPGASVEVDVTATSWNGVEVVRIVPSPAVPEGSELVHRFEVIVAPFLVGPQTFAPSVTVITAEGATVRTLPEIAWTVEPTLPADAPLELTALPAPGSISGAESPLLRPAIALAALTAVAAAVAIGYLIVKAAIRRARNRPRREPDEVREEVGFDHVEPLIDSDPIAAYRSLASIVRGVIGSRYGLPATALTTTELRDRMVVSGADRFQARLVGGFLEECDSVVYAGYRPAAERRRADLNMAREIVEAAG